MNYLRRLVDEADKDRTRINLSVKEDAQTAPPETPANAMRVLSEPQCDWCADGEPLYVYASSRMSTGEFSQCWRWMACARCNRDIENGNWSALERRARARYKQLFGARLAEGRVPESLIDEGVRVSLSDFHHYAIPVNETGGGKSHL